MALDTEYLRPVEWVQFYDRRRLLQLLSDTGTAFPDSDLTNEASAGYAAASRMLTAASATVDARCQVGRRYSRADLEGIAQTGRSGAATGPDAKRFALLQQLVADLAWGNLLTRRGYAAEAVQAQAPRYAEALTLLEQLYQGVTVFDLAGPIAAGAPSIATLGANTIRGTDFNRMFGTWPDARGDPRFPIPPGFSGFWGW